MKDFFIIILLILIIYFVYYNNLTIYENIDYNYKNDLLIINNFFDKNKFNEINNICKHKKFKKDFRVSSRKTICLFKENNKKLYDIIYKNQKLHRIINQIYNRKYIYNPSFPIEYRIYPIKSSGMQFHKDISMFNPDCLELVLTLDNNSDSKFQWFENDNLKEIKPHANTMCIVKPNSVVHGVSPTNNGTRRILKFIIEFKNSIKKQSFYEQINNCPI
jgi:hypothetical protein